jgi:hypothetical protein
LSAEVDMACLPVRDTIMPHPTSFVAYCSRAQKNPYLSG